MRLRVKGALLQFIMFSALITLVLTLLFILAFFDVRKPTGFPPGPSWLPLVGCYFQFRSLKLRLGYYHLVWSELTRKYGSIVGLRLGKDRIVIVSGYDAVKQVISREEFDGRPDGFFFRMRTFHQRLGVVFVEGPAWQEQRRFSTRHLRNLGLSRNSMENIISEEVHALVDSITIKCNAMHDGKGIALPLHNLCDISVLNTLWTVVAGHRFELGDEKLIRMFKIQHDAFRALDMSGGPVNQMPFLRFIAPNASGYNVLNDCVNGMHFFLWETLAEHRSTISPGSPRDLIDAFLEEMEYRKQDKDSSFSELQLISLCMDLFMAGSETTSNTLGFLLLTMLQYPEIMKVAQEKLDQVVGHHRAPTLADRSKLVYIDAIINEVQRLINVAPVAVPHRAMEDVVIFDHRVPKDTTVLLSIWSVHMDEQHWGDPHVFRPERFIDETGTKLIKDEWFIPFGLGKRRCLGEALARMSLFLFFSTLLQKFNFEVAPGQNIQSNKPSDGVTLTAQPFTGILTIRK